MKIELDSDIDVWGLSFEVDFSKPRYIFVRVGCVMLWVWL